MENLPDNENWFHDIKGSGEKRKMHYKSDNREIIISVYTD